ncbi:MAG: helix-turn-helix domain-containing protein [Planctomycetota bacterium]
MSKSIKVLIELSAQDRSAIVDGVVDAIRPFLETRPELVDADSIARILSLSRPTIDRLRAEGVIPSIGEGRMRRYDPAAVIEALKSREAMQRV